MKDNSALFLALALILGAGVSFFSLGGGDGYASANASSSSPILSPIGAQTVKEGKPLNINPSAYDPDGDPLTYYYSLGSSLPQASYISKFNATTGALTLIPYVLTYQDRTISNALTIWVFDNHGAWDSETISINISNETAPLVGFFSPKSGSTVYATSEIPVIINSFGVAEVGLYYRRLNSNDPLRPLQLINDPINNPEISTTLYKEGYVARFKFPAGEPAVSGWYDFEMWVKDNGGQSWWSGIGGNWILHKLWVNR